MIDNLVIKCCDLQEKKITFHFRRLLVTLWTEYTRSIENETWRHDTRYRSSEFFGIIILDGTHVGEDIYSYNTCGERNL